MVIFEISHFKNYYKIRVGVAQQFYNVEVKVCDFYSNLQNEYKIKVILAVVGLIFLILDDKNITVTNSATIKINNPGPLNIVFKGALP